MHTPKELLCKIFVFFHLDLTRNLQYDRLTEKIIRKEVKSGHNCIDVGCHKGEILSLFHQYAPKGKLFAFEPIPELYKDLKQYHPYAHIYPCALGKEKTRHVFHHVISDPAYSGLEKRKYKSENPEIKEIEVEVEMLDNLIPKGMKIDFMKIDVEGGEYNVFKGAKELLRQSKPSLLFEFGLGASDYYHSTPEEMFDFLQSYKYQIYTLKGFANGKPSLTRESFIERYENNSEYYFFAN